MNSMKWSDIGLCILRWMKMELKKKNSDTNWHRDFVKIHKLKLVTVPRIFANNPTAILTTISPRPYVTLLATPFHPISYRCSHVLVTAPLPKFIHTPVKERLFITAIETTRRGVSGCRMAWGTSVQTVQISGGVIT